MKQEEIDSDYESEKEKIFEALRAKMAKTDNAAKKAAHEEEYRAEIKKARDKYEARMKDNIQKETEYEIRKKLVLGAKNKRKRRKELEKTESDVMKPSIDLENQAKENARQKIILEKKLKIQTEREKRKARLKTKYRKFLIKLNIFKSRRKRLEKKYIQPIIYWIKDKEDYIGRKLEPLEEFIGKYWKLVMK